MQGLLYNQFKTFKMPLLFVFAVQILAIISAIADNTNRHSVDSALNICAILPYFFFLLTNAELFRATENQKWRNFAISTPFSIKGQVAVKYIFTLTIYAAILLINVIACLIMTLMTGENQFSHMQSALIFFGISLILSAVDYPFYFRFGSENGSRVKAASILFVLLLVLIYGLFGDVSFIFGDTAAQDLYNFMNSPPLKLLTWLIPTIAVVFFFISYLISFPFCKKGIEKSEN